MLLASNGFGVNITNNGRKLRTGLVYDNIFLNAYLGKFHPEKPERLIQAMHILEQSDMIKKLARIVLTEKVKFNSWGIHTDEHINSIQKNYPEFHEQSVAVVNGVLAAVDAVCNQKISNAFCLTRPPGHHARNTGREEGFCFYNSVAIAARYSQQIYGLKNILIVDWDYHHGNATELSFYSDPSVLYFSTHDFYAYPGTGDPVRRGEGEGLGFNINVHLDCGSGDQQIINAFIEKLVPAVNNFKPDMILISAGFDSREDDLLGCFKVTDSGYVELTRITRQLAERYCDGRIVSVLEGGYNLEGNASGILHHVKELMQ